MKRVTPSVAKNFVCARCRNVTEGRVEPIDKLHYNVMTVGTFCYLGDRMNASGGCEAAVIARTRIGWMKFREYGEILHGKKYSLKLNGKIYRSCVRSALLYGSETWCLGKKELILRTERAIVRAMCGMKLMDRKNTDELMDMLGLKETLDKVAIASGVRWFGHVLRRERCFKRGIAV